MKTRYLKQKMEKTPHPYSAEALQDEEAIDAIAEKNTAEDTSERNTLPAWDTSPEAVRGVMEGFRGELDTVESDMNNDERAFEEEYAKQLKQMEENNREIEKQREAAEAIAKELLTNSFLSEERIADKARQLDGSLDTILELVYANTQVASSLETLVDRYHSSVLRGMGALTELRNRFGDYLNAVLDGESENTNLDSVSREVEAAVIRLDDLNERANSIVRDVVPARAGLLPEQESNSIQIKDRTLRVISDVKSLTTTAKAESQIVKEDTLRDIRNGLKRITVLPARTKPPVTPSGIRDVVALSSASNSSSVPEEKAA